MENQAQTQQDQPEEVIQLDERETQLVLYHAAIRNAINTKLDEEEQTKIAALRDHFINVLKANGDAGRVAFQLVSMEVDNTKEPYDGAFQTMDRVDWDTALEMWKNGYVDIGE
jgi:hypothetical protein